MGKIPNCPQVFQLRDKPRYIWGYHQIGEKVPWAKLSVPSRIFANSIGFHIFPKYQMITFRNKVAEAVTTVVPRSFQESCESTICIRGYVDETMPRGGGEGVEQETTEAAREIGTWYAEIAGEG